MEVGDGGEGAAADGLAGDDAEEDLYHVQPRAAGRGEVQRDPGVLGQPGLHVGVVVGGVVVADDVQFHARVGFRYLFEEAEELDVAVAGVAGVGADLAGRDLECYEQCGGAVADVVVGLPRWSAG